MNRKKQSLHRVQYCPWFQSPTEGLGMYPPPIRGEYHTNECPTSHESVTPAGLELGSGKRDPWDTKFKALARAYGSKSWICLNKEPWIS
jgi:hypothetical protein